LYGVDEGELRSLVTSLLIPIYHGPEDDSVREREEHARFCIAVISSYTAPELADNCFWGDAIVSRKKRSPKSKRENRGIHNTTCIFATIPLVHTGTENGDLEQEGVGGNDADGGGKQLPLKRKRSNQGIPEHCSSNTPFLSVLSHRDRQIINARCRCRN
jgi:hypothetical protein